MLVTLADIFFHQNHSTLEFATMRSSIRAAYSIGQSVGSARPKFSQCWYARSFSSSADDSTSTSAATACCDIVKGPSLLRTTVHRPRPSLLQLPGLRSLPFWSQLSPNQEETRVAYKDPSLTWAVQHVESHWSDILAEYKKSAPDIPSDYQVDTEHHTLHKGSWDWHSYMLKGHCQDDSVFANKFKKTTQMLQGLREKGLLFEEVPFGYTFFSTLHGKSRIAAHSAPMNLRVRLHLPLIVPETDQDSSTTSSTASQERPSCGIRVGPITREWVPGKALLLDDSYDHEVWNDTSSTRVLLLIDLWHPDVTLQERQDIVQLFDHAKKEGWWTTSS